jgi:hypothetical protein
LLVKRPVAHSNSDGSRRELDELFRLSITQDPERHSTCPAEARTPAGEEKEPQMLSRTTTRTVTFLMPFSIVAANQELPAGAYLVETDEELIQGLSFPAYRRVGTFLRIPQLRGSSDRLHSVPVDPEELEAALVRDLASYTKAEERREAADDGRTKS